MILGRNGQLALSLKKVLQNENIEFYGRDDLDLKLISAIEPKILKIKPDFIINTAAFTEVDNAEKEKDLADKVNTQAPLAIAKAAKKLEIPLIHISTDFVFDGDNAEYTETEKASPVNYYGISKLLGENNILSNCSSAIIIRTSWLFSEYGENFLKTILKKIIKSEDINIIDNQYGKPTSAISLAYLIKQIIEDYRNKIIIEFNVIYHFANYPSCSWYDFAVEIQNVARDYVNSESKIHPICDSQYTQIAKRPKSSILSSEKVEKTFRIKKTMWKDFLKKDIKNLIKEI